MLQPGFVRGLASTTRFKHAIPSTSPSPAFASSCQILLAQAAPHLSRRLFSCHCRTTAAPALVWTSVKPATPRVALPSPTYGHVTKRLRSRICTSPTVQRTSRRAVSDSVSSVSAREVADHTSAAAVRSGAKSKGKSFPRVSDRIVGYWLLGSAASVFGLVVFGGLTRLTESGLSITEWRPVTGSLPPTSLVAWEEEFARYRATPEFQILNSRMTLDEFKKIYWMEWTHRVWGRIVGVTFLLPTVYFIARRRVSAPMAVRLVGICSMIGFQGFIGWWMVKSGLHEDLFASGQQPRVSQYRLTAHLATAFLIYLAMVWNGSTILTARSLLKDPTLAGHLHRTLTKRALRPFRRASLALALLIFATAMSGALVAGLDAGLIYNEFPYMGVGITPPRSELFDPFYSHREDHSDLIWRNALENPSLVQLDHRALATTTFTTICGLAAYARFGKSPAALLPQSAKNAVTALLGVAVAQVTLGLTTLLYLVPTTLAAAHQAGALALLTTVTILLRRLRVPKSVRRALQHAQRRENAARQKGGRVR